ncbi:sporulation histidine kinase inhibitor Sda [Halalkalibacter urbisdiaboli]|uniref:sporulation histidine kinase inhibitor Sda n=1 Tax=Halalkalibacter urbisdiaboli TaxID=1960589 RepID=UPI000B452337|nr:sporulation histidine kinase inhibitor Sda [Halalkalibacter urbisdiaboli]
MLSYINDEILVTAYYKAIELNLDHDLILLLKEELNSRNIAYTPLFEIKKTIGMSSL